MKSQGTVYAIQRQLIGVVSATMMCGVAQAVDWSKVGGRDVVLFYPGQASWEWVLTDHSASKSVKKGTNCRECHEKEEKDMGSLLVSGKKLEPNSPPGKPGFLSVNVKFARDDQRLYVRFEWSDSSYTSTNRLDPDYATKVAVMFDDGSVKEASVAGCWGFCHDDVKGMASATEGSERTLYLTASRQKLTRKGGGENLKTPDELKTLRDNGSFLEYWQARVTENRSVDVRNGYVLEKREVAKTPSIEATAELANGKWTIVMSRALTSTGSGTKTFSPGETFHVGFSLHDDYAKERHHYISFGYTLVLDKGDADFVAVKG